MKHPTTGIILLLLSNLLQAASYEYQGLNHQLTAGSDYTNEMSVNGHITFHEALPVGATAIDMEILGFSFQDGVQLLDSNNAVIQVNALTTDDQGMPLTWELVITAEPLPMNVGDMVNQISLRKAFNTEGYEVSAFGVSEPCVALVSNSCVAALNSHFGSSFQAPVTDVFWMPSRGGTTAVPVLSAGAFLLMVVLLMCLVRSRFKTTR